jgi:hypothetical protein
MPISCDPNDLAQAANCMKCIPTGMQPEVIIYLLQQIAGNTQTTDQLVQSAACFKCIPSGMQADVQTYLLCQIANAAGA